MLVIPLPLKRRFAWCLLTSTLIVSGCRPVGVNTGSGHPTLPFGDVDAQINGAALKTVAQVSGWAISEDGIEEVAVYIDRNYVASATLGVSRPDVVKAYPQYQTSASSGWQATIDLTKFSKGQHQLLIQARSKKGGTADVGKVIIAIVP